MQLTRRLHGASPATDSGQSVDDDPTGDVRLVEMAQADARAFAALYERYAQPVYFFCFRRLNHPDDAADATAVVFMRALAALPRFQPGTARTGSTFRAWLYTIARNVVTDVQRRSRNVDSLDREDFPIQHARQVIDRSPGPEDHALGAEEAHQVAALLQRLPERQCAVVELRLAGLSMAETATALDLSESAAKSLQVRAYRALRALIQADPTALTREDFP